MANAPFTSGAGAASGPASAAFAITPHNTNELKFPTRTIYVGGAGDVTVRDAYDSTVTTFSAVPAGSFIPIRATHVHATGTTATGLVGMA